MELSKKEVASKKAIVILDDDAESDFDDDANEQSAEQPSNEDGPCWTCTECTYENSKPLALACEMCGSLRTGRGSG